MVAKEYPPLRFGDAGRKESNGFGRLHRLDRRSIAAILCGARRWKPDRISAPLLASPLHLLVLTTWFRSVIFDLPDITLKSAAIGLIPSFAR
jgi:hypothetical protein